MPGLFKKNRRTVLGIDIGATSLKLVELSRSGPHYRVQAYAMEPLPANAVFESTLHEPEVVALALSRLVRRARTSVRKVALAVGGSAVITRTLEMDAGLSDEQMHAQLRRDAEQFIPYPLDEVAIDFQVQGAAVQGCERVEVLLAACRIEHLEAREAALALAGLTAQVIDVETFALARTLALLAGDAQRRVAVFELGASVSLLRVFDGGALIYSREQSPGAGGLAEPQALVQQLQAFFATVARGAVDQILLTGDSTALAALAPVIEQQLGTPTQIANPFAGMTLAGSVDGAALATDAPALMVACGLALRSFDG
ncbi:type IV pilus assembly protein PilM [Pseudomonas sp. ok272]|uniref:type IV pilus assembly protein PilM n=1 Tax=unclassified Pseudomonas TaxID=196821 RepID=UPI0008D311CE|nr:MULTISPECIES: type IV pilus assembly protein PilM [unclassified Pseudomonas]SEN34428.1 type IV pilus assembly protein PilM [Pseudomonas sp. ok272]SFM84342.1 type IV pilus assembly protein PilM [Pseudomonas sp. ok602]